MRAGLDELRDLFVHLAGIRSPSLEEREMAGAVKDFVRGVGLEAFEDASAALTGCDCGNLIVRVPGRGEGTPIALCAHLDTVPLERAPTVIVENGVVRTDGETILGADDKAAVAPLLMVLRDLALEPPAADVEIVFTVAEEIGLQGAKALDPAALAAATVFVFDSEGEPGTVITAAPTLKAIEAEFRGVAAHAGIEPQHGRSAIVAAARALADMDLGRIDDETTANVGLIEGGSAVNIVAERCVVRAEARSRDEAKLAAQVAGILAAKNTPVLVPLCHPLRLTYAGVTFKFGKDWIEITSTVRAEDSTGVEMEALAACAGAALTVYDMAKSEEKDIVISSLKLLKKTGGKSGDYFYQKK